MPKLLLVEDNDLNRDMLYRRLLRRGHDVALAINGEDALLQARTQPFDLIVMDLRLPDLSGWEVTRALRGDERTRKIPIIALTAHARESDRAEAIEAGCDDYDTKPVDMIRLSAKIANLLDRREKPPA